LQSAEHGCIFATAIPGVPVNAVDLLSVFPVGGSYSKLQQAKDRHDKYDARPISPEIVNSQ